MIYEKTNIPGILTLHPEPCEDHRGTFVELYRTPYGVLPAFPNGVQQISQSKSHGGVIRGLHLQYKPMMSKIMRVIRGAAWIVSVDMRATSDTFLEYHAVECRADNEIMVFAPGWAARGFFAMEHDTVVEYFHDATYEPASAVTINFFDPLIGIDWPTRNPIVSKQDANGMSVENWMDHSAFHILA